MLSLPTKVEEKVPPQTDENKTDTEKGEQKESKMDLGESNAPGANNDGAAKKPEDKPDEKSVNETPKEKEGEPVPPRVLTGLMPDQVSCLVRCSVYLIGLPVDPDTLHALLRLVLRLTREHEHAVTFAELGGVKLLLTLTQVSDFQGFASLATLILRHILEDPSIMKPTLQKVCDHWSRSLC